MAIETATPSDVCVTTPAGEGGATPAVMGAEFVTLGSCGSAMPLLIPTHELQPGMRLHEPLVTNGRVLMQADRPLSEGEIHILRRRFPDVSVRITDPMLDGLVEFGDDSRERRVADQTQRRVANCVGDVHSRISSRTALSSVDVKALQSTVNELMEFLRDNPTSSAVVANCLDQNNYLSHHTGNVFYLSMLLAFAARDYVIHERCRQTSARDLSHTQASDLMPLGLGTLIMDLGMAPHEKLLKLNRTLTKEESDALREHPLTGAEALPDNFSSVARIIVKTHHENVAGTGYPAALPAERVHVFSRIARIADAYSAATSGNTFRGSKSPARVLWEMSVGPLRKHYDPNLIRAFLGLIQPFSIGAKLKLKDGRHAVVVGYNQKNPFRPLVIVAFDSMNRPLPKDKLHKPLPLNSRTDLSVASFGDEDLGFLYAPVTEKHVPQRDQFTTALQCFYP